MKIRQLIKDYVGGMPQCKIFKKYRITQKAFCLLLNENSIARRDKSLGNKMRYYKRNIRYEKAILNKYLLGVSINKLETEYKMHYYYIKQLLLKNSSGLAPYIRL